jgi:hypothetical protein
MQNNNEHIEQEENGILNQIPKQNNFKTPSDYFENFSNKIENELHLKNKKSIKRKVLITMFVNLSIAAAVVLGVFIFKPSSSKDIDRTKGMSVSITDFQDSFFEIDDFEDEIFEDEENLKDEIANLVFEYDLEEIENYIEDIGLKFEDDIEL